MSIKINHKVNYGSPNGEEYDSWNDNENMGGFDTFDNCYKCNRWRPVRRYNGMNLCKIDFKKEADKPKDRRLHDRFIKWEQEFRSMKESNPTS